MKNIFVAFNVISICSDKNTLEPHVNSITVKYVNVNMILSIEDDEYYTSKLGEPISNVCVINGEEYLVLGSPEGIIYEIHKEEKAQV